MTAPTHHQASNPIIVSASRLYSDPPDRSSHHSRLHAASLTAPLPPPNVSLTGEAHALAHTRPLVSLWSTKQDTLPPPAAPTFHASRRHAVPNTVARRGPRRIAVASTSAARTMASAALPLRLVLHWLGDVHQHDAQDGEDAGHLCMSGHFSDIRSQIFDLRFQV